MEFGKAGALILGQALAGGAADTYKRAVNRSFVREAGACGNTGAMQPGPKAGMQAQPKPTFESRCVY